MTVESRDQALTSQEALSASFLSLHILRMANERVFRLPLSHMTVSLSLVETITDAGTISTLGNLIMRMI